MFIFNVFFKYSIFITHSLAEVLLVPAGGDPRLGAPGALETAKVKSNLSDER